MVDKLIALSATDLIIGEPLQWPIYDSNGTFLVKKGFVIQNASQIERLISRGVFGMESEVLNEKSPDLKIQAEKLQDFSPFKLLEDVTSQLAITLLNSEDDNTSFTEQIMVLVKDIQRACDRDAHAAIASLFVLEGDSYPIKHSVDVAVLSEIMAKSSAISIEERQSIIAAALTMNIAMISLQEKLYRQKTPLTPEQKKLLNEHPRQAVMMLRKAKVEDRLWLQCVLSHHETIVGTGYPNKLTGEQYPRVTQFIALADRYCAHLSPRSYRDPLLHKGILRDIFLDKGQNFEPEIAALFIKELGFYPPGLLVQLVNSEIGVVTKRGERPDSPLVHVCMKPRVGNYSNPIMRNTTMDEYKITRLLLSDDPDVTFERRSVWRFSED
jgi:HD-GYP domain-containing protein (c-di-GMP phosphodiesterase class II)